MGNKFGRQWNIRGIIFWCHSNVLVDKRDGVTMTVSFSFDPQSILQFAGYAFFIVFMMYGTKLQLMQLLAYIKNKMTRLAFLRNQSLISLEMHIKKHTATISPEQSKAIEILINSIAIPPVSNLDPAGMVPKMENIFKTYDKYLKSGLRRIVGNVSQSDLENLTNSLEVAIELNIFFKVVDHFYRLAKKGDIMMAYMLKMGLAQLMEMGEALFAASTHFQSGLPIGDTFGPMVASRLGGIQNIIFSDEETTVRDTVVVGRKVIVVKAKGPGGSVGNPGFAVQDIVKVMKPSLVITIDAALRMESEKTGDVNEGVGTAMGGNGTERFEIEGATIGIPVLTIVCKMNLKEAISQMPKAVLDQVIPVYEKVLNLIRENSESGETVIVVGVGNTMGCE